MTNTSSTLISKTHIRSAALLAAFAVAGSLLLSSPAGAAAQATCRLQQLSSLPAAGAVSGQDTSSDGRVVAAQQTSAGSTASIVIHRPGQPPDAPAALSGFDSGTTEVAVSGDGEVIYLTSRANPRSTNGDHNRELFRWSADDGLDQITFTVGGTDGAHLHPSVDEHGHNATVLTSRTVNGGNSDGNTEVARVSNNNVVSLVTATAGASHSAPAISADGTTIVFGSRSSQLPGTLNADGSAELFSNGGGLLFQQLTSTSDGTANPSPSIAGDGTIAFDLNTSQLGINPDGNQEIFLRHPDGTIEQVSSGPLGSMHPDISLSGSATVFVRQTSAPGGSSGPHTISRWARTGGTTDLGARAVDSPDPTIDGTGASVSFVTDGDGGREAVRGQCRTFSDVTQDHQFWSDVEWMSSEGITNGFPDGSYKPGQAVSRQAMSAFLYRLEGSPAFADPQYPSFTDVNAGHPFSHEIEWMAAEGISTGYTDQTFRPQDVVSRGAMSAFLFRVADPAFGAPSIPSFSDVPDSYPFYLPVEWMAEAGITNGFPDGTFKPGQAVSRQAMSAFMHRLAVPSPQDT